MFFVHKLFIIFNITSRGAPLLFRSTVQIKLYVAITYTILMISEIRR
jgi:hypothetical protein